MDNLITVHDFLNQILGLLLIHAPDFLSLGVVSLLESLKFLLEILEYCSVIFVLLGQLEVDLLVFLMLFIVLGSFVPDTFEHFCLLLL